MVIAVVAVCLAIFFYLLLSGTASQRNWAQEDLEQAEYLRDYCRRKEQRGSKRR